MSSKVEGEAGLWNVDPHSFNADPDPVIFFNADPDPGFLRHFSNKKMFKKIIKISIATKYQQFLMPSCKK